MERMENRLIEAVMNGNKKEVLNYYEKFINKYKKGLNYDMDFISLKNYLICLNCILYRLSYENIHLKENIFKKRNQFIADIDEEDSFESLSNLGEKILMFYTKINRDKYFYTSNEIVNKALNYIHNNLNEDLSLEDLAKEVHISKNHLCNLFSLHTGTSFSEYINKVKIEYGKKLLKETTKPLVDIAFECGFNSQSYFCSVFKKVEGMTPLEYKKVNIN